MNNWYRPKGTEYLIEECCEEMRENVRGEISSALRDFQMASSGNIITNKSNRGLRYCPFCGVKFNIVACERPPYT